jgi:hypothetical protein
MFRLIRNLLFVVMVVVSALSFKSPSYAAVGRESLESEQSLQSIIAEEEAEREKEVSATLDSYMRYMPSSSVDAQSGKVTLIEAREEASYSFKLFDKLPVQFLAQAGYIGIENSTAVELPAHLTGVSVGVETTFPFFNFDKTYMRVGAYPSFYGDDWSFESSEFRIPMRFFVIKEQNDKLIWVAGVGVKPDFDTPVYPIIGFIYRPNDQLTFNIVGDKPSISYALNDKLTMFVEGGFTSGEYEVDREDINIKNTILKYRETHCGLGLKYKFNKNISCSVLGGGSFNRQLKYEDSYGKVNIDSGPYAEFRFNIAL